MNDEQLPFEEPQDPVKEYWSEIDRVHALEAEHPGPSPFDVIRQFRVDGSEFWSARDLMPLLGYEKWDNFTRCVDEARRAASIAAAQDQFADSGKMVKVGSGARREVSDVEMTRYGAYMVAMSCDGRKVEVAEAKTYFAIKTREAEVAQRPMTGTELMAAALKEADRVLQERDTQILELSQKITDDAPKVAYVERYVADADLLKLRTVAANNDVGEEWLRDMLVDKGWVYVETESRFSERRGCVEIRRRYSAYANKRSYFRPVEVHEAPRFKGEVMHTLKVTPAGAEAITRFIARNTP